MSGQLTFATLRLGKDSVSDINLLDSTKPGAVSPPVEISVTCTQVPNEMEPGCYVFIWLGSDNNKGGSTEWKQGFKAIGRIKDIIHHGTTRNDPSDNIVEVSYIFTEAVNRIEILRDAPLAYYWCSAVPIIGLDDRANQTIRLINIDDTRSNIRAFLYALNAVRNEMYSSVCDVYPDFEPLFDYTPPNPKLSEISSPIRFKTGLVTEFEQNRIVFGAPGTGKSYVLKRDCSALLSRTGGAYERVTFHPEYSYSQFVGTYKPMTDEDGEIRYDFVPGPFMRVYVSALKDSRSDTPRPHLLLIEEINRAKVAAVFGEVFQLLDRDKDGISEYEVRTTEDIKKYLIRELGGTSEAYDYLRIPDNMFIWASMNSADQGVFPIDTAFKRRWNFEYIGINENDSAVKGKIMLGAGTHVLEVNWNQLRKAINERLAIDYHINEDKLMGPYFLSAATFTYDGAGNIINADKFKTAFKNKVIMYLYEDAAKQYRNRLFSGCDNSKFSSICASFDDIGIDIFGDGFREIYDRMGE